MGVVESSHGRTLRSVLPGVLALSAFLIVCVHRTSVALVRIRAGCAWPADWPRELDEVRNSCRTIEFAAGTQENIYEIVFDNRENFEKLWPVLLTVKTPGAPLRLRRIDYFPTGSLMNNAMPAVRIFGPAYGVTTMLPEAGNEPRDVERLLKEGKALRPSPPWPKEIISANGELPEYVQSHEEEGRLTWVPSDRNCLERGFLFRARVDLELVVDGSVIDLNRTQLPSDDAIIDRRFDPKP
jgi:hypothetical protein